MAVKVVGYDESIKKRASCHNCSAILEYVPADVQVMRNYEEPFRIICPECGTNVQASKY